MALNKQQTDMSIHTLLIMVSMGVLAVTISMLWAGTPIHENSRELYAWSNGLALSYLAIYSLLKTLK